MTPPLAVTTRTLSSKSRARCISSGLARVNVILRLDKFCAVRASVRVKAVLLESLSVPKTRISESMIITAAIMSTIFTI